MLYRNRTCFVFATVSKYCQLIVHVILDCFIPLNSLQSNFFNVKKKKKSDIDPKEGVAGSPSLFLPSILGSNGGVRTRHGLTWEEICIPNGLDWGKTFCWKFMEGKLAMTFARMLLIMCKTIYHDFRFLFFHPPFLEHCSVSEMSQNFPKNLKPSIKNLMVMPCLAGMYLSPNCGCIGGDWKLPNWWLNCV